MSKLFAEAKQKILIEDGLRIAAHIEAQAAICKKEDRKFEFEPVELEAYGDFRVVELPNMSRYELEPRHLGDYPNEYMEEYGDKYDRIWELHAGREIAAYKLSPANWEYMRSWVSPTSSQPEFPPFVYCDGEKYYGIHVTGIVSKEDEMSGAGSETVVIAHDHSALHADNRLLLRRIDVAHLLQVSERTVQNLQTRGLKYVKMGRNVRFKYEDVVEFAESLKYE